MIFDMKKLFSFGELYVSDFIKQDEDARAGKHDLTLIVDERYGAVRLEKCTPTHSMFGKYWYRSGINTTMRKELSDIVESILKVQRLKDGDLWLDIACNDGTLFNYVPNHLNKLGIDPAEDSFTAESRLVADEIIQDYFTIESYNRSKFATKKAKVITCIAMFYDLDEPIDFLRDVKEVLDDDGLFVVQMSYTPLMIKQLAFDNITHEHVYYWSLSSLNKVMTEAGLKIVDCQINDVNGGSFRIYIKKENSDETKFATRPFRDVCNVRVETILNWEQTQNLDSENTWLDFYQRVQDLKKQTVDFIKQEKLKGKKICGYGASSKGNTLLQYFELDETLLDAIAERSPFKYGHKTIGTNIPILSEDDVRKMNPDYMLVLPWHFISEFIEREHEFLSRGGKFIVPCPKFEVIGKDNL
jgi:SAM-dependent methyltransferase